MHTYSRRMVVEQPEATAKGVPRSHSGQLLLLSVPVLPGNTPRLRLDKLDAALDQQWAFWSPTPGDESPG